MKQSRLLSKSRRASRIITTITIGTKSDIVFLHGTGSNARMWKNQVAFFTRLGHKCTLIYLRGHGQSHEPYEKTDLEVQRKDVLETLQNSKAYISCLFCRAFFRGYSGFRNSAKASGNGKGCFCCMYAGRN